MVTPVSRGSLRLGPANAPLPFPSRKVGLCVLLFFKRTDKDIETHHLVGRSGFLKKQTADELLPLFRHVFGHYDSSLVSFLLAKVTEGVAAGCFHDYRTLPKEASLLAAWLLLSDTQRDYPVRDVSLTCEAKLSGEETAHRPRVQRALPPPPGWETPASS